MHGVCLSLSFEFFPHQWLPFLQAGMRDIKPPQRIPVDSRDFPDSWMTQWNMT
jgi:hypothetical protein